MNSLEQISNQNTDKQIAELKYRVEMLNTFIDNSDAGMYVIDYYTCEILFANRKMVSLGGNKISVGQLIGKNCWQIMNSKGDGRCSYCPYKKLVGSDGELLEPYVWERNFTEYGVWLKVSSQAIRWTDGRLAQMTTFYDITESKKMEEQLARLVRQEEQWRMHHSLQIILDLLPLPIKIVDMDDLTISYGNKKFLDMFEFKSIEEIKGLDVTTQLPPEAANDPNIRKMIRDFYLSDDFGNIDLELVTATGKVLETRVNGCVIDYNGKKSVVEVITDYSFEKEQKRRLTEMAEQEREANRSKSYFLSNMSHEIRTPMNAIIGLTEIELRKNLPAEILSVYKKINSSANNLLQIINDILDLSKIEAGKLELFTEEFEIEEVLSSALLVVSPKLQGKQVELILDLSLDLPRYLIGDKTRVWQILRNHLDNAAKFTTKGKIVLTVKEETEKSTDDKVFILFSIRDTGNGMSEEQLKKAFLPYEQVSEDAGTRYIGSGLGLPISKHLCEMMDGTLDIESTPGYGTTISFIIPFERSRKTQFKIQASNQRVLEDISVLIVDDSVLSLKIISTTLENCGAKCVTVQNGAEALQVVKKGTTAFDIIIIDYVMEGLNGLETAKLLNQHFSKDSKIFILTAYESLLDIAELRLCGVEGVIEKPFIPSQFIQKIGGVIGRNLTVEVPIVTDFPLFSDTKILICEDNEINQEIAVSMLEQFSITTLVANNGKEGIEILEKNDDIDMILMDLHMPVLDGYEATKLIRENPKYDRIPIISLTADAMVETINRCLGVGINDFISKPVSFKNLQRVFQRWIPPSE